MLAWLVDLSSCCFVACCVLFVCVVVDRFVRFSLTHLIFLCVFMLCFCVFFGVCLTCLAQGAEGSRGSLRGNPKTPRALPEAPTILITDSTAMFLILSLTFALSRAKTGTKQVQCFCAV